MTITNAKNALDLIIHKSRVHLYKPIQIAEILYRDRVYKDIDLNDVETYRNASKGWRDEISIRFVGRRCTSSAKFQDNIFEDNAMPPRLLNELGQYNRKHKGIIEAYIYDKILNRFTQMSDGLQYSMNNTKQTFSVKDFIEIFWETAGLRRSIDKIYEIVVYALFSALVDCLNITIKVSSDESQINMLKEFSDFTTKVIGINSKNPSYTIKAKIHRVGVTNAADRGLDMWADYGMAIQIKHLSLTEELADEILQSVSADRIVIVCKDSEEKLIISLLNQIGWKSRIQSIITEQDLILWYEKALRGVYSNQLGDKIINCIQNEIQIEFPITEFNDFHIFQESRGYDKLNINIIK